MKIINGKKFYAKDINNAKEFVNCNGFDTYNGRNYQWYHLLWDENTNLVILRASNSGDCYGDYGTYYFESPSEFAKKYDGNYNKLWSDIFSGEGNGTEEEEARISRFVDEAMESKTMGKS